MNHQNIGATTRHKSALRHGAGRHLELNLHHPIAADQILSRAELREIVAAMID